MESDRRIRRTLNVFTWPDRFKRRNTQRYKAEDVPLHLGQLSRVAAFLETRAARLQPPQFNYVALKRFLDQGHEQFRTNDKHTDQVALIDERSDDTG